MAGSVPRESTRRSDRQVFLWLAVTIAFGCAFFFFPAMSECLTIHGKMATIGDAGAFADYIRGECPGVTVGDVRLELYADFAFIALYGTAMSLAFRRWWDRAWRATRLGGWGRFVIWLPVATALADVVENIFLLLAFSDGGLTDANDSLMSAAAIAGRPKWVLMISSLVALVPTLVRVLRARKSDSSSAA